MNSDISMTQNESIYYETECGVLKYSRSPPVVPNGRPVSHCVLSAHGLCVVHLMASAVAADSGRGIITFSVCYPLAATECECE